MLNFAIPLGHVAALALANFLLSWAWYSPLLFAKPWMLALGMDPDRGMADMSEAEKKKMPFLMLGGVVSSLLKVLVMALLVGSLNIQDAGTGAELGLLAWAGLTLSASIDTLWEGRKPKVLLINNALFALTYAGLGAALAVWR